MINFCLFVFLFLICLNYSGLGQQLKRIEGTLFFLPCILTLNREKHKVLNKTVGSINPALHSETLYLTPTSRDAVYCKSGKFELFFTCIM